MFSLERDGGVPIYQQLRDGLRCEIESGRMAPGSRVPSSRQLARDLGVSRITVLNAYAELEADGLIGARPGGATYVLPLWGMARATPRARADDTPAWQQRLPQSSTARRLALLNDAIRTPGTGSTVNFAWSRGDPALFCTDELRKAMAEVLREEGGAALGYEPSMGYPPLQRLLSRYLLRQGVEAAPDEILITAGAQQAIDLAARALVRPGDRVVVECPSYPGALDCFEAAGAELVGVPVDGEGLQVEAVEQALAEGPVALIYTVPTFHNPTGSVLSAVRRRELLTAAQRAGVPILEDDYLREMHFGSPIPPPLAAFDRHGNVIHVGSFSKSLAPAVRLGYVVAQGPLLERLVALKAAADICSSPIIQRALCRLLESGVVPSYWKRTSRIYRRRQAAMLAALRRHFPAGASCRGVDGGLVLWVNLPAGVSARRLQEEARQAGVTFGLGAAFCPRPADQPFMRLNFAAFAEAEIERGIRSLGRLVESQLRQGGGEGEPTRRRASA